MITIEFEIPICEMCWWFINPYTGKEYFHPKTQRVVWDCCIGKCRKSHNWDDYILITEQWLAEDVDDMVE